jgi:hypothetical protein
LSSIFFNSHGNGLVAENIYNDQKLTIAILGQGKQKKTLVVHLIQLQYLPSHIHQLQYLPSHIIIGVECNGFNNKFIK